MAIGPKQLKVAIATSVKDSADRFEKEIDNRLGKSNQQDSSPFRVHLSSNPALTVKEELRRRYQQQGWRVVKFGTECGDQRDQGPVTHYVELGE